MQRSYGLYLSLKSEYANNGADGVAQVSAGLLKNNQAMYIGALDDLVIRQDLQNRLQILEKVIDKLNESSVDDVDGIYELYKNVIERCNFKSLDALDECVSYIHNPDNLFHWMKSLNENVCIELIGKIKLPEHNNLLHQLLKCAFKNNLHRFVMYAVNNELTSRLCFDMANDYQDMKQIITDLMNIDDPVYRLFAIQSLGVLYNEFGRDTDNGVLLTLAALYEDGKVTAPTMIVSYEENSYIDLLKDAKPPLTERFIYCDSGHWLCGEISVDDNHHVRILILDSLGMDENPEVDGRRSVVFGDNLIAAVLEFDKHADVYLSKEVRQYSSKGCSVFSLDDIRHLESMPRYIDSTKYPGGIFEYLNDHSKVVVLSNDMHVKIATLPLRLMRTMQSRRLPKLMAKSAESDLPLNKRGMTGREYAESPPGFIKNTRGKTVNARLELKLNKMIMRNIKYLASNSYYHVKLKMAEFKLAGLKKRIADRNKKLENSENPSLRK